LIIQYKTNNIQKICTNADAARRKWGNEMARIIHQRIDELKAATSVEMMIKYRIGHCHKLKGNRKNQYALDLLQPYRLIFIIVGNDVEIVEVQEIVDYH
jgi:proteic killer suppression protein